MTVFDHLILNIIRKILCIKSNQIIVGMGIEVSEKVIKLAHEREIVIIMSPYDTFTIARLINQSIPVRYIMKTDNLVTFNTEDFTDDIQNEMIKHRHRAFPVINKKGKCIGTISRRNFLDMHRKKVALVDHNEKDQAVDTADRFAGDNGISGIGSTDICQGYQTTLRPKFGQIERIGILPQQTACLLHKSRGIVKQQIDV